jgi:hypothetical protein
MINKNFYKTPTCHVLKNNNHLMNQVLDKEEAQMEQDSGMVSFACHQNLYQCQSSAMQHNADNLQDPYFFTVRI